jgi:hypothetical protein
VALAYGAGGLQQFFPAPAVRERRGVCALVVLATLAAFIIFQFTKQMESLGQKAQVNWNLLPAGF